MYRMHVYLGILLVFGTEDILYTIKTFTLHKVHFLHFEERYENPWIINEDAFNIALCYYISKELITLKMMMLRT